MNEIAHLIERGKEHVFLSFLKEVYYFVYEAPAGLKFASLILTKNER